MHDIRLAVLALALTLAPTVFAQTYIVADGDCGAVTLHATHGTGFPHLGAEISADRVNGAYVWALPNERRKADVTEGAQSTTFGAEIPDEGVVMAAVELKPEVIGNETRTEHAKALIFCGPKTPPIDWQRTIGLGLEIYPQGWNGPRPRMKAGDPMRFIAVDRATKQIIPDLAMDLYGEAGLIAHGVPAVHSGMNFPYQKPGRYMVVTTYRRADPKQPEHWLVDTSTLTFDIR